jgi:hypothetical protein
MKAFCSTFACSSLLQSNRMKGAAQTSGKNELFPQRLLFGPLRGSALRVRFARSALGNWIFKGLLLFGLVATTLCVAVARVVVMRPASRAAIPGATAMPPYLVACTKARLTSWKQC